MAVTGRRTMVAVGRVYVRRRRADRADDEQSYVDPESYHCGDGDTGDSTTIRPSIRYLSGANTGSVLDPDSVKTRIQGRR